MKKEKYLSIREYSKRVGVSHVSIQKAIKTGKISKGYDSETKTINPDIADQEYGFQTEIKKINEKLKENISQQQLDAYSGVEVMDIQLSHADTAPEALRKQIIIKAQLDLLKLKTESGQLVNKEEVYKEIYAYGKEIRMSLQTIPDRIIDQLITMDRNDAHQLLTQSINESLIKLTTIAH
jgi:hypothetical protein